jgi:hypothetical protein
MKKSRRNNVSSPRIGPWLFLCLLIASFAVSTGVSYFFLKDKFSVDNTFVSERKNKEGKADDEGQKKRLYGTYDAETDRGGPEVQRQDTLLVVAEDVIRKYVQPYKVKLLDLYMDKDGVIYIDLSDEFKISLNVDAGEELKMIAGLYDSIKSTIPGFSALKILIEGREAESLAGHIDISKPIGAEIEPYI